MELRVLLLALAVAPVVWGSVRLRRRFLPGVSTSLALLADLVLVLATVLVASELLGAVGLFRPVPLALVWIAAGVGGGRLAGRSDTGAAPAAPVAADRFELVVTAVLVFAVAGAWIIPTMFSARNGVVGYDSLWYHLPIAARFAQTGWLTRMLFVSPEQPLGQYPASAEVLHAIGMSFTGSDVVSAFVNVFWLGALLLAARSLGRETGPFALALTALVVSSPRMVLEQGGSADNDVAAAFFLIAAAAFLLEGRRSPGRAPTVLAGAAAGGAIAVKLTAVVPVAALSVFLLAAEWREMRRRLWTDWLPPLVATGGFWYLRNLARTGSPFSAVRIGVGRLSFPVGAFESLAKTNTIASYLNHGRVWRMWFLPGLANAFGPVWWLVFVLWAAGVVLALVRGPAIVRALGATAVVGMAAYLVTPHSAGGPPGRPVIFAENTRFALAVLLLGLVLLPVAAPRLHLWTRRGALAVLAVPVLITLTGARSPWRIAAGLRTAWPGIVLVAVTVAAMIAIAWRGRRGVRALAAASALVLVAGGAVVEGYPSHRYLFSSVAAWADGLHGQKIAVDFNVQYPLYGASLTNDVRFPGLPGPHGAFHGAASCAEWRSLLRTGRYAYVVLGGDTAASPNRVWTGSDPGAELLFPAPYIPVDRTAEVLVYAFDPSKPDPGCA